MAADSTFLEIPGLVGPSTSTRHPGWFDVSQDTLVLRPGVFNSDKSAVVAQCTAIIRTQLGATGATVATRLIGAPIGNVTLDRISSSDPSPLYHAVLRDVVLTDQTMIFDSGVAYDLLSLRFDAIDVTTYLRNPDGSVGQGTQGSFDCLRVP